MANLSTPQMLFNNPFLFVHLPEAHELPLLETEGVLSPSDLLLTVFCFLGCIYNGLKGWILQKLESISTSAGHFFQGV